MYPIFTSSYGFFPTAAATNASTALDATAAHLTLSSIIQDHSPISDLPGIPGIDQLSTTQSRALSSPEEIDCYVVAHVTEVVKGRCMHQGGLENTELVFYMTSWTINSITDDPFLREYYYWLTIYWLYTHDTQWDCLSHHLPLETATSEKAPSPPSLSPPSSSASSSSASSSSPPSSPQESACSPLTINDASRDGRLACDNCNRTFSRKDALLRHHEKSCTYNKGYTSQHVFSAFV